MLRVCCSLTSLKIGANISSLLHDSVISSLLLCATSYQTLTIIPSPPCSPWFARRGDTLTLVARVESSSDLTSHGKWQTCCFLSSVSCCCTKLEIDQLWVTCAFQLACSKEWNVVGRRRRVVSNFVFWLVLAGIESFSLSYSQKDLFLRKAYSKFQDQPSLNFLEQNAWSRSGKIYSNFD